MVVVIVIHFFFRLTYTTFCIFICCCSLSVGKNKTKAPQKTLNCFAGGHFKKKIDYFSVRSANFFFTKLRTIFFLSCTCISTDTDLVRPKNG